MDGIRISLGLPGRSAAELVQAARWADVWNVAALWIGDPRAQAPNSGDSYATTAAAGVASVTESLRLGVFLTLPPTELPERIAEDVAVVDQMSGGRLELCLVPPAEGQAGWVDVATRFLRSWNEWPLPDGGSIPVLPLPAQPVVPRVVLGGQELAGPLLAGRAIFADDPDARGQADYRGVRPRTILILEPAFGEGVIPWLADGAHRRVRDLREQATDAGAGEILLSVSPDHRLTEDDFKALGVVVVPTVRAFSREADRLVTDAWRWLTEKGDVHDAPVGNGADIR